MKNVLNALDVLEAVAERQPIGVGDLSRALGQPKSSVQRCLVTLSEGGWIRPTGGELARWVLTTKPLVVGAHASNQYGLRDCALPVMQRLRAQINETVSLMLYERMSFVLLDRVETTHVLRPFAVVGSRGPLVPTAGGRAILARLPRAMLKAELSAPLRAYTASTKTKRADVLAEIERARLRGYAMVRDEWNEGVTSIASAIVVGDASVAPGGVLGALTVTAPSTRVSKAQVVEYGALARAGAVEIAELLNAHTAGAKAR